MLRTVLGACLAVGITTAEAATVPGGKMIYARRADSLFLDPVLNDANVDIWVLTYLYDTLIIPSNDGKSLTPGLATEWGASADGKTFTLKLRSGVKFADGTPLTLDDVIWSLTRASNQKEGIWSFLLASVDSVEGKGDDVRGTPDRNRAVRAFGLDTRQFHDAEAQSVLLGEGR